MSAWPELLANKPVNTSVEIGAYELLWQQLKSSKNGLPNSLGRILEACRQT